MQAKGIIANMALQAMVSAASPFRKISPEVTSPTLQAVSMRLMKRNGMAKLSVANVEAEEGRGDDHGRDEADHEAKNAHDHERQDEFAGPQRAHEEMAEIARPDLLEKAHREAELAAKQHVPKKNAADQRAGRQHRQLRGASDVKLQEAPGEELHRRPIGEIDEAHGRGAQKVKMALDHRHDARGREAGPRRARLVKLGSGRRRFVHGIACAFSTRAPAPRPRATSRKTSSSVSRP